MKKQVIIIGRKLTGHNSLPFGYSITVFTVLAVLLFSFMPKSLKYKSIWYLAVIAVGLILVFTRVAVRAHYPLDVIASSIIGYISGLAGIFISRNTNSGLGFAIKNTVLFLFYYF